ncbi:MAG: SAM-dependent methyltransferase [Deltaproteobacteria bacterium HGW-Deltaproteobacteria-4]|nr:MAG: SAM-dependent methyltransferase [Deltaproteobacteria bacterium HGW-Deltaproteobacteria-4]
MDQSNWNPAELLKLSGGYWSACALHAGVKLDLFSQTGTAADLAQATACDVRGLEMLLNALTALGLLNKDGEHYAPTAFAAEYLARHSPRYLGYIIMHHHHLMAGWSRLDEAVQSGAPLRGPISHAGSAAEQENFEMGMFNLAMQIAPSIVAKVDLHDRQRLLDLGGGPGTYAIQFCQANPQLIATVYDLATTRPFAAKTITNFGLDDRITFVAGDFISDDVPGGFDVAWLSHILHGQGLEGCAVILQRAVAALEPGGLLLVQEFILDDSMGGPLFPALFSLNMLLNTPQGQAYSQGQLEAMLRAAGVGSIRRLELDLPNGARVLAGIVA